MLKYKCELPLRKDPRDPNGAAGILTRLLGRMGTTVDMSINHILDLFYLLDLLVTPATWTPTLSQYSITQVANFIIRTCGCVRGVEGDKDRVVIFTTCCRIVIMPIHAPSTDEDSCVSIEILFQEDNSPYMIDPLALFAPIDVDGIRPILGLALGYTSLQRHAEAEEAAEAEEMCDV